MNTEEAALCLAELGHSTRVEIYRYLVKMGNTPVPVGSIQEQLGIPASTLSHHLSRLTKVGLVQQERDGRILYCAPIYQKLQALLQFLTEECCQGQGSDNTGCDISGAASLGCC